MYLPWRAGDDFLPETEQWEETGRQEFSPWKVYSEVEGGGEGSS